MAQTVCFGVAGIVAEVSGIGDAVFKGRHFDRSVILLCVWGIWLKATTKPIEGPPKAPSIPGVTKTVTLRIDQDVLEFVQDDGPGWQDRINAALRKAAGK